MADPIDLGAALDTVVAQIAAEFDTFNAIVAEDEGRKELPVPAIVVQLSELEPSPEKDPHTGQFPCLVRFEARIVLGHRTPTVRREAVKAAGALAAFLHNNRLTVPWGAATIIAVGPDDFAPIAAKYDVWSVEWVHQADIGPSYFVDDAITPLQVLASWVPEIGLDHEPDYEELTD